MLYRDAGVDIEAGNELVRRIKPLAKSTHTKEVVGGLGGFAGLCALPSDISDPLLVSGTDGVGTKLKLAFELGRHDTVGIDLVAMCVNDIVTLGARPLFFLDYIATGKLNVDTTEAVVKGIAAGCLQAGCALLGGETAELPGMVAADEYDLAGFVVGVVSRSKMITGERVQAGDALIAIGSSGLHSNGYSLARSALKSSGASFSDAIFSEASSEAGSEAGSERSGGQTIGDALLCPTRIYAATVAKLCDALGEDVHALAHITGGGLTENVPRVLPAGLDAQIDLSTYARPKIFGLIERFGDVPEAEMRRTFNLGVGMVLVVPKAQAGAAVALLQEVGETAWALGEIVASLPNEGAAPPLGVVRYV